MTESPDEIEEIISHSKKKLAFMKYIGVCGITINNENILQVTNDEPFSFDVALLKSAMDGQFDAVKLLLEIGCDSEIQNALIMASFNGHYHVAELILHNCLKDGSLTASSQGSSEVTKLSLQKQINENIIDGWTALMAASKNGHHQVVELLLKEKADPNIQSNSGWTALMVASQNGHHQVVELLLKEKADCNIQNNSGWTALMEASQNGHHQVVELLLKEKADPKIQDNDGRTALIAGSQNASIRYECAAAFKEGNLEQALYLLHLTDEPKLFQVRINFGISYVMYCCRASLLHLSSRNGWFDVVKDLITNYHFDPQETDDWGNTCLHYAAEGKCNVNGSLDVMKYLINHYHCNPMATNSGREPVLHYAVKHIDIVKYLITECGCDPMTTGDDDMTTLHYAAREGSTDVIKYLINDCNCDPMSADGARLTSLHHAVISNNSDAVEYLLSTGKCDPLARDCDGDTPMKLAAKWHKNLIPIFKKFGKIKSSHPVDSYVNVLLLGNPGAGKSTLSHVITDTATGSVVLGTFRNVKGVEPCTAGIIPTKLQHKTLGNIILHDFGGHSEYYSSHSAVIENLLQGSGGVFLIVVNILEKEAVKQLHQWLTVVRNETQKALDQCHIIVVASHVDEISDSIERRKRKEEIQEIIGRERCDSVYLDCRKLGGSGMGSFFNKLSSACESIRSTSGKNLSLYCDMMYGLLEERKENILTLSDVMSAAKDNDSYILPDEREKTLDVLHSLDSIGLISVVKSEDKVWVIVNKEILLSEVNGILFAPETFKEHVDIASNTGIVSVSGLTRLFPDYDPDMLICFLKKMELCQEMNPSFLETTNLHQLSERGGGGERLLFFPSLLYSDRPDEMTSNKYQFGWCLYSVLENIISFLLDTSMSFHYILLINLF